MNHLDLDAMEHANFAKRRKTRVCQVTIGFGVATVFSKHRAELAP